MIVDNIFVYFLWNDKNQSYYVTPNGAVVTNAGDQPLKSKPIGWQDIELSFDTVDKYFSNVKSLSVPLQYVDDGAKILRYLLYKGKGFEETVFCVIFKWNPETGIHELEYKGKLDLSKAIDDIDTGVTVNAKEGGFQSDLDALEDTVYELPLDETNLDAKKVTFDGVDLFDTINYNSYEIATDVTTANYSSVLLHNTEKPYVLIPLVFLSNEGDSVGVASAEQSVETFGDTTFLNTSENTPFKNFGSAKKIKIVGDYNFSIGTDYAFTNTPANFQAFIFVQSQTGVIEAQVASFDVVYGGSYTVSFNNEIQIPANSKVFLAFRFPTELSYLSVPSSGRYAMYKVTFPDKQTLKISFNSRNEISTAYFLEPLAIANQLVKKWDLKYSVQSQFLSTRNNIVVTSGMSLRGLKNPVLKYSWKDFFDDYNKEYCLGITIIGNVMYIERREDRYSSNTTNTIFDLRYVNEFKLRVKDENIINTVKVGWPDQKYDERNGRYEFNSTTERSLPVTAKKGELNLIGTARGDCYGIEFIRGKLNNLDTTDNQGDNENFMVNVARKSLKKRTFQIFVNYNDVNPFSIVITNNIPNYDYFSIGNKLTITGSQYNDRTYTITDRGPIVDNAMFTVWLDNSIPVTPETSSFTISFDVYVPKRVVYDTQPLGLITPNIDGPGAVYNIEEMTPTRRFMNWSSYIHSVLLQLNAEKSTFQTSLKNADLSTTLNGVTISEKADIVVGKMNPAFFLNYVGSFKANVPLSFSKTLSTLNSAGQITATVNGFEIYFLPIGKMSSKPATNEAQDWELTLSAKNDLDILYKLSQEGLYINDGMDNTITLSIYNPVHCVYYNKQLNAKYKYLDLFDDWVHHRNNQFAAQPAYLQKWEWADTIQMQMITNGIPQISVYVYDNFANLVDTITSTIITDPAIISPNVLQQITINPSDYSEGNYLFAFKAGSVILFLSEWQSIAETHPGTYAIEYYSTSNKQDAYFTQFRPMIRVEAMWGTEVFDGTSSDYKDETRSHTLGFETSSTKKLYVGNPWGIPEYLQAKLNSILFLDRVNIEDTRIFRPSDSKWETIVRNGYPLNAYSIDLQRSSNKLSLSVTETGARAQHQAIYTFDAEAWGLAPGVKQIEID